MSSSTWPGRTSGNSAQESSNGRYGTSVVATSIRVHHLISHHFPAFTLIFLCAFGTLALSFWPYMIPFVLTIEKAAAPQSSLAFMFWGEGLFVFPLMLLYTAISYGVFRGKVSSTAGHYLSSTASKREE